MKREIDRYSDSNCFEGMVSVRTLIENMIKHRNGECANDRAILKILYDEERTAKQRSEYLWLCHRADEFGFELKTCPREEIDNIAIGSSHGGVICYCSERNLEKLSTNNIIDNGFYVMLQGIEDPYNFGYALRSLYAAGVDGIVLGQRNWMSAAGVVCRASAGASELLNVYVSPDDDHTVNTFKSKAYKLICADLRDSVPIYDADMKLPLFLVIGGEKRGISRSVISSADQRVRIDYGREFEQALSAASAATIVGFEVYRQNKVIK